MTPKQLIQTIERLRRDMPQNTLAMQLCASAEAMMGSLYERANPESDRDFLVRILALAEDSQAAYPLSGSIAAIIDLVKQELEKTK